MSIKKIEGYLNGFVNIHVEGYFIERFINMCRIQKIYLWNIAKKFYGNGSQYTKIYNANRDKIKNPNLIYPNQVLWIPA